jgi:hypothetical protein
MGVLEGVVLVYKGVLRERVGMNLIVVLVEYIPRLDWITRQNCVLIRWTHRLIGCMNK